MGLQCEINIFKPSEGVFKPGETVKGMLKYNLKEDTLFSKITVSFKGNGYLLLKSKKRENNLKTQRKTDSYVDIDYVIYSNESGTKLPFGSYQTQFNFILPQNIPTSLKYFRRTRKHLIRCQISYFIIIKFERPGLIKSAKKFRKEIKLISITMPTLPMELTVYGVKKTLTHILSKNKVIDIKAFIENSVTTPGERIKMEYEVSNNTNIMLKGVITKLIEAYTFKVKGSDVQIFEDVKDTETYTGAIKIGETRTVTLEIKVPSKISSLEYSNLVLRSYFICIAVEVPKYPDAILKIPVQISDEIPTVDNEVLPSYWEVLRDDDDLNPRRFSRHYESDEGSDDDVTTLL